MSKCYNCGTDYSGQFCPTCGSQSSDSSTPVQVQDYNAAPVDLNKDRDSASNYGADQGYNVPQAYDPPPAYNPPPAYTPPPVYPNYVQQPQYTPTSAWGWFGWSILVAFLPIIGQIIMLLCAHDPSAKNYAKMQLTVMIVTVCIVLIFVILGIVLSMLGVASLGVALN